MNALEKEIVSVAISSENEKEIKKYSFRRRITQMKENPELFKESWGIFEEEDAFNKKYNKGNRNNWLDSLEDWSEKAYRKKKNKKKKLLIKDVEFEDSETDEDEKLRIQNGEPCKYDLVLLKKLTNEKEELKQLQKLIKRKIVSQKKFFFF